MAKTNVRVTIEPGVVRSVDDAELIDLERQGLIHSRELREGEERRKGEREWKPAEPEADTVEAPAPTTATKTKGE